MMKITFLTLPGLLGIFDRIYRMKQNKFGLASAVRSLPPMNTFHEFLIGHKLHHVSYDVPRRDHAL